MNDNILFIVTILIYIVIIILSSVIMSPGLVDHYYPANAMLQNNGFISNLPNTQMFNENAETSATAVNHIDNNDNKLHNGNITIASHAHVSTAQYDKIKSCTTDLDTHPTSIEYLTYLFIPDNNQTVREFTIIVEENSKIPISNEGQCNELLDF